MPFPLRDNIFQEKRENLAKEARNLVLILIFKVRIVLSQNFLISRFIAFMEIAQCTTVFIDLEVIVNLLKS